MSIAIMVLMSLAEWFRSLGCAIAEVAVMKNGGDHLQTTFTGAKQETEMILFTCVQKVLEQLHISPQEVRAWLAVRLGCKLLTCADCRAQYALEGLEV